MLLQEWWMDVSLQIVPVLPHFVHFLPFKHWQPCVRSKACSKRPSQTLGSRSWVWRAMWEVSCQRHFLCRLCLLMTWSAKGEGAWASFGGFDHPLPLGQERGERNDTTELHSVLAVKTGQEHLRWHTQSSSHCLVCQILLPYLGGVSGFAFAAALPPPEFKNGEEGRRVWRGATALNMCSSCHLFSPFPSSFLNPGRQRRHSGGGDCPNLLHGQDGLWQVRRGNAFGTFSEVADCVHLYQDWAFPPSHPTPKHLPGISTIGEQHLWEKPCP